MLGSIVKLLAVMLVALFTSDYHSSKANHRIVLITLDGVRWQDIFDPSHQNLLPNLNQHFISNGMAIGYASPALVKNKAHVSLPGYLEIMQGYPVQDCLDNQCRVSNPPSIIDHFPYSFVVFASWLKIKQTFRNRLGVVNTGNDYRNQGWKNLNLPNQISYPNQFDDPEYRTDLFTEQAVLRYLKINQPDFLWIALGDTDEFAHQNNRVAYLNSLQSMDNFIGQLISLLDPETAYIVSPDHGRSDNFTDHGSDEASARIWILIGGKNVPKLGLVQYHREVYLSDIFPTILRLAKNSKARKSLLDLN